MSKAAPSEAAPSLATRLPALSEGAKDRPFLQIADLLLEPDANALVEVELVDYAVDMPTGQFEALLVDSECEV